MHKNRNPTHYYLGIIALSAHFKICPCHISIHTITDTNFKLHNFMWIYLGMLKCSAREPELLF